MKIKQVKGPVIILAGVIGAGLCFGIYYLMDTVWNGSFVEWFMDHYMYTHDTYPSGFESRVIVTEPIWSKLKILLLTVSIIVVMLCIIITFTVSKFYAKSRVEKSVTATSRMLHDFMVDEVEASSIFPKEYAEISAQMSEIKATMQRHEHLLKEEAARKNDLIAYLAHDLKTPLTSVIGYLSLLEEAPDMPPKQKAKYVNITLDKAHRLEQLINEFFDITRYNLQQIHLEKESIDLSYMLVQMTDEFYPLLHAHGNAVNLEVPKETVIYGDSLKLARVFNNILKNAIAYSYPDTAIDICVENSDTDTRIYFCNKGKTIPARKLELVFDKFFRLDEARTTNTGGSGLGLAIAKEIVSLHGGGITAESENEVTTFCVSLPVT